MHIQHHGAHTAETPGSSAILRKVSYILEWVIDICLSAIIILTPLFFLPITLDVLELNKQTLLIALTLATATAWLGKSMAEKRLAIAKSWFNIVVVIFLAGWLAISAMSKDLYISIFGNFGQMQFSFITILALVILYFLFINNAASTKKVHSYIISFLVSGILVGVYGIMQLTGVFSLGWLSNITNANTFNTIGTINSMVVYMVVPLVLAAALALHGGTGENDKKVSFLKKISATKVIIWLALLTSVIVLVLVDFWVAWVAVLFGVVILVGISILRSKHLGSPLQIAVPLVLAVIAILLLIFKTPINLNLPAEVSPSLTASWNIAKSALQENPLFGSGPGTWIYDYAKYRSPAVNLSQFWTVRFERGLSSWITLVSTVGVLGMALLLMIVISALAKSATFLMKEKDDEKWQLFLTVFVGWFTLVFIAFFYNYNFTHIAACGILLSLMVALIVKRSYVFEAKEGSSTQVIISIMFTLLCVGAFTGTWAMGQRLFADAAYSDAVMSYHGGQDIDESINSLNRAIALGRWNNFLENDVYYRNLSQAYLIKASNVFPEFSADPEKAPQIGQIVAAAIDTGKKAAEINPANVDNWENLAIIYQSISVFTQGADDFAILHFQDALEREPNNPVYSNEIGKLHIIRADALEALKRSEDPEAKQTAELQFKDELDTASEWFNRSIQAKPDFAPAHYFLGLVYERQGRTQDAITKLEQVLQVNDKDVGIAFQLAILYYRNNEKDKSVVLFEQIVAYAPRYANARWYLSALYEENGELGKALEQTQIVAETNPDNKDVADRITYLQTQLTTPTPIPSPESLPNPVSDTITTNPDVGTNPF